MICASSGELQKLLFKLPIVLPVWELPSPMVTECEIRDMRFYTKRWSNVETVQRFVRGLGSIKNL